MGAARIGYFWALASAVSFGLMSWLVHAAVELPPLWIALVRGLVGLAILTPLVGRRLGGVFAPNSGFLWLRALSGALSILCYYWNLQRTSVGTAKSLQDLAPVIVAAFSVFVLREDLRGRTGLGIVLAIAGALAIGLRGATPPSGIVVAVGVLGALAAATAFLSLREAATEHSPELVVWMLCASSSAVSAALIASGVIGEAAMPWHELGARGVFLLAGVALSGLFGQLWMTRAYQHLPASIASALGLTALLWGVLFEISLSGARPALADWCGYALILLGAVALRQRASPPIAGSPDDQI